MTIRVKRTLFCIQNLLLRKLLQVALVIDILICCSGRRTFAPRYHDTIICNISPVGLRFSFISGLSIKRLHVTFVFIKCLT